MAMTEAMVLLDPEGRILAINGSASQTLRLETPDHVIGRIWSQLWPAETEAQIALSVIDAARCGMADLTAGCRAGPGDGAILDMEMTGRDGLIFVTLSDVTDAWRRGDRPRAHVAQSLRMDRPRRLSRVA